MLVDSGPPTAGLRIHTAVAKDTQFDVLVRPHVRDAGTMSRGEFKEVCRTVETYKLCSYWRIRFSPRKAYAQGMRLLPMQYIVTSIV